MKRIDRKRFDIEEERRKTDKARKKSIIIMAINIAIVMVVVFVMSPSSARVFSMRLVFSAGLFAVGVIITLFFLLRWFSRRKR